MQTQVVGSTLPCGSPRSPSGDASHGFERTHRPRRGARGALGMAVVIAAVVTALPAGDAQAAFPGGNGKIVFASQQGGGTNIFVMNADGSAQAQLTTTGLDDYPAWSADGQRIVFQSQRDLGLPEIYVMNADGSQQTRLTTNSVGDYVPTWSPDGQKIAFVSDRDSSGVFISGEIYVMNADGSAQTRLTTNTSGDGLPAWSPDGQKIAFVSTRDVTAEIYVMNPDGSAQTRLTTTPPGSGAFFSAWSPDGERIVFILYGPDGRGDIWAMNANGSSPTQLTADPLGSDSDPAWSPDGQKMAFVRGDGVTPTDIWTMNADGSAQARLPSSLGADSHPDWQPLPNPIIFLHGFLGSKIACGANELWPHMSAIDRPRFPDMRLAADGVSNLPGTCGAQVGGIVGEVVIGPIAEDIYKSTADFLNRVAPGRNYLFTWDWRTSPAESLARLDSFVDNVRTQHANAKVVLMAHSMGGLLTRWYIDDQTRADKVARALTIGTPYWGSPKSLFPLAAGLETPQFSAMDAFFDNGELQDFARNLLGLYFLYPSANYGPWLTVASHGPGTLDGAGLLDYVGNELAGNPVLLDQALDAHTTTLDGFKTNGVDYRVVVGTGMNTISGVTILDLVVPDYVQLSYASGDQTVAARSGVQGTPGTTDPLGEDVPIYYACGVSHVPLPGNPDIDDAIEDFLLSGADVWLSAPGNPGLQSSPCPSSGFQIGVYPVLIGSRADLRTAGVRPASAGSDTAVPLEDAELQGLVQVLSFPNQTIIVTDTARPVDLALPPGPIRLEVTPLNDEEQGPTLVYESLDGQVTLAASETLTVFEDGEEVEPSDPDTTPPTVVGVPDRAPNAAGWYRAPVTIDWQATDDSGSASDPQDTIASIEGASVVYSSAPSCDPSGNCTTGSLTLSIDTVAPALACPPSQTSSATSASGAIVSYPPASVSDAVDTAPVVTYSQASGTLFPIGTTTVAVTATDAAGNSSTCTFTVTITPAGAGADLAITNTDSPDPVTLGSPLTYTVTLRSNGPQDAAQVWMAHAVLGHVRFVSATASQGHCLGVAGLVTCNLGTLANGATATVRIVVVPKTRGSLSSAAYALSRVADPNLANNQATTTTRVR